MDAAYPTDRASLGAARYPVSFMPPPSDLIDRWWGIPFVGTFVRALLLIPHFLVLALLSVGIGFVMLVGWIPILVSGRVPDLQQRIIKETIHRSTRTRAYLQLLPGGYPPFGEGEPGPVHVTFDTDGRTISRWWGIPFFGAGMRMLVAIPHFFVLSVLTACCSLVFLVVWIPILLDGLYPRWAMTLFEGTFRYTARVTAYVLMLPVPYPPFSLDE